MSIREFDNGNKIGKEKRKKISKTSIQDYYSNIINVEPFIGEGLKKFNYSLRWLNFPSMGHKIGRIYRNPDYKYEIIIPDNSSPSPSSRGRSSQPTKRDYLTKSNRNELLFLSIHPSLSSLPTDLIPNRLLKSFVQSRGSAANSPPPLHRMGPTFFNPRISSSSFSFLLIRIESQYISIVFNDPRENHDHRFRQPIDLLPFTRSN